MEIFYSNWGIALMLCSRKRDQEDDTPWLQAAYLLYKLLYDHYYLC